MKSEMSRAAAVFQAAQAHFLSLLDAYKAKLPAEAAEATADEPAVEDPAAETDGEPEAAATDTADAPEGDAEAPAPAAEVEVQPDDAGRLRERRDHERRTEDRGGITMAAKTKMGTDDLLEQFKDMTLLELSEFIKAFEEAFDVHRRGRAGDDGGTGRRWWRGGRRRGGAVRVRRRSHRGAGDKKTQATARSGHSASLGLKGGYDLVDGAPKPVLERVPKEQADQAKEQLEGAGASVEVK